MVQFLSTKSSKWVRHNQVSLSSFYISQVKEGAWMRGIRCGCYLLAFCGIAPHYPWTEAVTQIVGNQIFLFNIGRFICTICQKLFFFWHRTFKWNFFGFSLAITETLWRFNWRNDGKISYCISGNSNLKLAKIWIL